MRFPSLAVIKVVLTIILRVQEKCWNSGFDIELSSIVNSAINTYTQSYSCIEWKYNVFIVFLYLGKCFDEALSKDHQERKEWEVIEEQLLDVVNVCLLSS